MYNHNKAQQSKNRVHIYWDILYILFCKLTQHIQFYTICTTQYYHDEDYTMQIWDIDFQWNAVILTVCIVSKMQHAHKNVSDLKHTQP